MKPSTFIGLFLILLTSPLLAKSTARQLELLEMRTRQLRPYNGPAQPRSSPTIGSYRYARPHYRSARQARELRRWQQNEHQRRWLQARRLSRQRQSLAR